MKKPRGNRGRAESSACAKLILFGEHAVVYGYPAIAVPLPGLRLYVSLQPHSKDWVRASGLGKEDREKMLHAMQIAREQLGVQTGPLLVSVRSQIPFRARLGSSAGFSVALLRALALFSRKRLSARKAAAAAHEMEKLYHGTPSGIDTEVSAHEKPLYFVKGKNPEFLRLGARLSFIVANTGRQVSTKKVVADVRARKERNPGRYEPLLARIGSIAEHARESLESGNLAEIGKLMNLNQKLLKELGVSSRELDGLVRDALKAGALGAKLTGAGIGGCMVALASGQNAPAIARALRKKCGNSFIAKV